MRGKSEGVFLLTCMMFVGTMILLKKKSDFQVSVWNTKDGLVFFLLTMEKMTNVLTNLCNKMNEGMFFSKTFNVYHSS